MGEVSFLSHVILKTGINMDSKNIKALLGWKSLTNVTKVWSFLRLVGYYFRFVKKFSYTANSLTKLLIKGLSVSRLGNIKNVLKC